MSPDEYAVMVKLRVLPRWTPSGHRPAAHQLRKTRTNIEFLMQIAKSTPGE